MRRALAALLMVSMTGCGGEVVDEAAAQAAKDCKRTYNALEKGYRELLHQAQIGEFTFPTKEKWTTDCVAASLDKAAEENERQNIVMQTAAGQKVGIVQIAGLVARRILLESAVGDELAIGQQFGIIRFGSRVDLWLPADTPVLVLAGQRTVAGETVLADLSGTISEPMTARQQ